MGAATHSRHMAKSKARRMTPEEIKIIKSADKSVSVAALAKKLHTSTVTVRRYLNAHRKDAIKPATKTPAQAPVAAASKTAPKADKVDFSDRKLVTIDKEMITIRIPLKMVISSIFGTDG